MGKSYFRSSFSLFLGMLSCLSLTSLGGAQLGKFLKNPSWPSGSHRLDVQSSLKTATGLNYDGVLGCAKDASGNLWLSTRRASDGKFATAHKLFRLDKKGKVSGSFDQPLVSKASAWGIRDLAYDGSRYLYGGLEISLSGGRVFAFDTKNGIWDSSKDFLIPPKLSFSTIRALAFDPNGDGGNGSLWTSDWDGPILEFSKTGKVLRTFPGIQGDCFGAAYHPRRKTVWFFGQKGYSSPQWRSWVVARELDPSTGVASGLEVLGDPFPFARTFGGKAGGMEFFIEGNTLGLALVQQAEFDHVVQLQGRFDTATSSGGRCLMAGGPAILGNNNFQLRLVGGAQGFALLMIGLKETSLSVGLPNFAAGSRLFVDLNLGFMGGVLPVSGGVATANAPIPLINALKGLDLVFQWVEIPVVNGKPVFPFLSSKAGVFSIHNG
jgi:hypothetical protein